MKLPLQKVTFVVSAIEFKSALAHFVTLYEIAGKANFVIVPGLGAVAVLLIILPLTFIHASISVHKNAHAIGLAISPVALVYVPVGMHHPTLAIELLVQSHAMVHGAIRKVNDADAFVDGGLCYHEGDGLLLLISVCDLGEALSLPLAFVHLLARSLQEVLAVKYICNLIELIDPYQVFPSSFGAHEVFEVLERNQNFVGVFDCLGAIQGVDRLLKVCNFLDAFQFYFLHFYTGNRSLSVFFEIINCALWYFVINLLKFHILGA